MSSTDDVRPIEDDGHSDSLVKKKKPNLLTYISFG